MTTNKQKKQGAIALSIISVLSYVILGYYTQRNNSVLLFSMLSVLFTFYFILIYFDSILLSNYQLLLFVAIICRLALLISVPALSDDYFRFIWDGQLLQHNINPYMYLPSEISTQEILKNANMKELYENMNSPHYYSVYPPVLQAVFYIASKISFNTNFIAILILRLVIILAEVGTFIYLKKIVSYLSLPKEYVLWYVLNPLIIIELTGNLHFEGLMLFFIVASFYYLLKNKLLLSSLFFALAISTKMIPLVLLPLIVKKVGLKKGLIYSVCTGIIVLLGFLPFVSEQLISHIGSSVQLYFQKFEFNASIYYMVRWVGFQYSGYNEIALIGKAFPIITFVLILIISFKKNNENNSVSFFKTALLILFTYYSLACIVHPWYISVLVLLSVITQQKVALVWSALVFISYQTYAQVPYTENLILVFIEYAIVFSWFFIEIKSRRAL